MTKAPFTPKTLDRYTADEEALEGLHDFLAERLGREDIVTAARQLGLLQAGEEEEVTEEEMDILMAYAMYGYRREDETTAVETLPQDLPPHPEQEESDLRMRIALPTARFAILQPKEFVPPFGMVVHDLLRDEELFLFEPYLSELEDQDKDIILTTWLLTLPEFTMTNSAMLVTAGATLDRLVRPLEAAFPLLQTRGISAFPQLSRMQQADAIALLIQTMLTEHLLLGEEEPEEGPDQE